jgi:hypothetical protein
MLGCVRNWQPVDFADFRTYQKIAEMGRVTKRAEEAWKHVSRIQAQMQPIAAALDAIYGRRGHQKPGAREPEAYNVWTDPRIPPAVKSWLKQRLADPQFRSRFDRFQKCRRPEDYKPEVAVACLAVVHLANESPAALKARFQKMHQQFNQGRKMDPANLNRLWKRIGFAPGRGRPGRPPSK